MIEKYLFLCDQKKCEKCSFPECRHTADVKHAKNKKGNVFKYIIDLTTSTLTFWEVEEGEE